MPAVIPEYQKQGIGTRIIEKIIEYVQNHLQNNERCSIQLIAAKGKRSIL